jgi:hypothetical protein
MLDVWQTRLMLRGLVRCGVLSVFCTVGAGAAYAQGSITYGPLAPAAAPVVSNGVLVVLGLLLVPIASLEKKEEHRKHSDIAGDKCRYSPGVREVDRAGKSLRWRDAGAETPGSASTVCLRVPMRSFLCISELCGDTQLVGFHRSRYCRSFRATAYGALRISVKAEKIASPILTPPQCSRQAWSGSLIASTTRISGFS